MNSKTVHNAPSIISFLLTLLRTIFLLLCFGLIIWGLFALIDLLAGAPSMYGRYPVFLSSLGEGVIRSGDGQGLANLVMHGAAVDIKSEDLSSGFVFFHGLINLFWFVCFLISIHLTIQMLEAIKKGEYFVIENAIRLRWIALLWIGLTILTRSWKIISSLYLDDKLEFSGLTFKMSPIFQLEDVKFVATFLFLLVIAEAFRAGALLKEENDLTI